MTVTKVEMFAEIKEALPEDGDQAVGGTVGNHDLSQILIRLVAKVARDLSVFAGNPDGQIGKAVAVEIARGQRAPEEIARLRGVEGAGTAPSVLVPEFRPAGAGGRQPRRRPVNHDDVAGVRMTVYGRTGLADREIRNAVAVEIAFGDAAAPAALWTLLVNPQRLSGRVRQLIAWIIAVDAALSISRAPGSPVRRLSARVQTPDHAYRDGKKQSKSQHSCHGTPGRESSPAQLFA